MGKTRVLTVFFLATLLIACTGCQFFSEMQLPESVSIKSNAEYNVALGSASYDTSETFGTDAILSKMQSALGTTATVYDYVPSASDDTLSYLIKYPVYSIPIDVSTYLDSFDLDSAFNSDNLGFNFTQNIVLPSVSIDQTQAMEIPDVSTKVLASMKETLDAYGTTYTIPEPGSTGVDVATYLVAQDETSHNSITISGSLANTIKYTSGSSVLITVEKKDATAATSGYTFTLTATITTADGAAFNPPITASKDVTNGGTLTLDFGGKDLPNKLKVTLGGTLSGGSNTVSHSYAILMSLSNNTQIDTISGITASASELGITLPTINQSVSVADMVGYFSTATIGTGSVTVQSPMPTGWTNITCTPSIKLSGAGMGDNFLGAVTGSSEFIDQSLDLNGKTLAPTDSDNSIAVSGSITLNTEGGSIQFTNGSSAQTVTIAVKCNVTTLSTATVDLTSSKYASVPRSKSLPTDGSDGSVVIPTELLKHVSNIDFCSGTGNYKSDSFGNPTTTKGSGLGITCKVVNSLPSGNNIPVTLKSTFMKFDSVTETIAGTGSTTASDASWVQYPKLDLTEYSTDSTNYIDFSFAMADTLDLTNLTMGSTYTFGISDVAFVHDWDYLTLKSLGDPISGSTDLSSFNLGSMLTGFGLSEEDAKKISLVALPAYFYAQKPSSSALKTLLGGDGDISLKGTISAVADSTTKYFVGSASGTDVVSFVDKVTWPDSGTTINSSNAFMTYITDTSKQSFNTDFAEVLNQHASAVSFNYNLTMSGATKTKIYSAAVDSLKASGDTSLNIDIDMAAILSFKFTISSAISMDIMKMTDDTWEDASNTSDLLQRSGASDYEDYLTYSDAIKYINVGYTLTNKLISYDGIKLTITDAATGLNKTMSFTNGSNNFGLSNSEIQSVMTKYPFHPIIDVVIPATTTGKYFSLNRSALSAADSLKACVTFSIKMNGDTPITVWGGKE